MRHRRRFKSSKALEAQARIRGWRNGQVAKLTELQDLILTATACATPGLEDLAREAKVSVHTLSSWRRGTRTPPPDAVEVLAAVLRDRSDVLAHYARRLREASGLPESE